MAIVGVDPLAFRLNHIQDTRMRRVLQATADAFGWSSAVGPSGKGHGIALSSDAGSCVATIAEAKVDKASARLTASAWCARRTGGSSSIGNARRCRSRAATSLAFTLTEELRFRGGEVLDRNFGTYHLPRFSGGSI